MDVFLHAPWQKTQNYNRFFHASLLWMVAALLPLVVALGAAARLHALPTDATGADGAWPFDSLAELHLLDTATYPDALCLDGSPGGYALVRFDLWRW